MERARNRAVRRLIFSLSIALMIGAAASSSLADTVVPGPVIVLPDDVVIPVPAPPSNADPMNPASPADVVTQRYNNLRTGTTLSGGLDQFSVSDPRFGLLGHLEVRGVVLAQPLYLASVNFPQGPRSVVFIADSLNWVYAFDAVALTKIWDHHLGDPYSINDPWNPTNADRPNCLEIMAQTEQDNLLDLNKQTVAIGIESTPVIDLANSHIIVSYRGAEGDGGRPRIAALNLFDGNPAKGPDGRDLDRQLVDDQQWNKVHRNRASLLLEGGHVYVGFAGRCENLDSPVGKLTYQGWIYALHASTLAFAYRYRSIEPPDGTPPNDPTLDPTGGGGIWQASTGIAADGHGNLYFATGNQTPCGVPADDKKPLKCSPPDSSGKNLSDSIVRLRVDPAPGDLPDSITMTPADWFMPYRKTWLDVTDLDFAAAGVVLIPNSRYLVAGGKSGMLYVLDRDHLGKFDGSTPFDASTVAGPPPDHLPPFHTSGDPVGVDDARRDHVVQKFSAAENKYCADHPSGLFCLGPNEIYPAPLEPLPTGVTMNDWTPWPHIHGTPVFGAFPDGRTFLYLWAEKDRLKSFRWWGKRLDPTATAIATNKAGAVVLAPPYLRESPPNLPTNGMPGGMLALSINSAQAAAGVLFASVQRCRMAKQDKAFQTSRDDPGFHECSVDDCSTSKVDSSMCGEQRFGILRAFNPFTLRELWNNQSDPSVADEDRNYWFAKFVPPTIANGRVFLATGSKRVQVYGIKP